MSTGNGQNVGRIIEIKGVVLDAVFDGHLPAIYNALEITMPEGRILVAEVQQHLGDDRVRAVAMDATDGLARGTAAYDTGGLDQRARRRGDAGPHLQRARRSRSTRRDTRSTARRAGRSTAPPPAFERSSPTAEIFETGIKVIDLLAPYVQRRQDRPLRRRRRRQDGAHPGADQQHRQGARRRVGLRRRGRAHARGQRPLARDDRVGRASRRPRSSSAR